MGIPNQNQRTSNKCEYGKVWKTQQGENNQETTQTEQRENNKRHNKQRRRKFHNRRTFEEEGKRQRVLNMKSGNRTLSIVSINPYNFTPQETKLTITHILRKNKIHIASIQETQIPHNQNYKLNGYRIITCKAQTQETNGMHVGGVARLIREELEQHIVHIHRIDHRIVKIALRIEESHTPITIINAYAPHQGKTKLEQEAHWAQQTIPTTPTKHLKILRAGANGQIQKIRQEQKPRRIFGPFRKQEIAEKGNGRSISTICYQENMTTMNTWEKAPLTTTENIIYNKAPTQNKQEKNMNKTTSTHGHTQTDKRKDRSTI